MWLSLKKKDILENQQIKTDYMYSHRHMYSQKFMREAFVVGEDVLNCVQIDRDGNCT